MAGSDLSASLRAVEDYLRGATAMLESEERMDSAACTFCGLLVEQARASVDSARAGGLLPSPNIMYIMSGSLEILSHGCESGLGRGVVWVLREMLGHAERVVAHARRELDAAQARERMAEFERMRQARGLRSPAHDAHADREAMGERPAQGRPAR